jgi:hypothetical protein
MTNRVEYVLLRLLAFMKMYILNIATHIDTFQPNLAASQVGVRLNDVLA